MRFLYGETLAPYIVRSFATTTKRSGRFSNLHANNIGITIRVPNIIFSNGLKKKHT